MEVGEKKPFVPTCLRSVLHRHTVTMGGKDALKVFIDEVVASFEGAPLPDESKVPKWLLSEYEDAKRADYIRYMAQKGQMFDPKRFYNWLFPADPAVLADRDFVVEKKR